MRPRSNAWHLTNTWTTEHEFYLLSNHKNTKYEQRPSNSISMSLMVSIMNFIPLRSDGIERNSMKIYNKFWRRDCVSESHDPRLISGTQFLHWKMAKHCCCCCCLDFAMSIRNQIPIIISIRQSIIRFQSLPAVPADARQSPAHTKIKRSLKYSWKISIHIRQNMPPERNISHSSHRRWLTSLLALRRDHGATWYFICFANLDIIESFDRLISDKTHIFEW